MGQAITRLLWRLRGRNAENSLICDHCDGNNEENCRSVDECRKPSFFDLYSKMGQAIIRILRRLLGGLAGKPPSDDQYYPYFYNEVNYPKWSADDDYYIEIGIDTANDQQVPVVFDSLISDVGDDEDDCGGNDDAISFYPYHFNEDKHGSLSADHPYRIDIGIETSNNQQVPVVFDSVISHVGDDQGDGGGNDDAISFYPYHFKEEKRETLSVGNYRTVIGIDKANKQKLPVVFDSVISSYVGDHGEGDGGNNDVVRNILVAKEEEQPKGRCLGAYGDWQKILLVGEGDFSFSASLAIAFGDASKMVATSLDSFEFLMKNYKNIMRNIFDLTGRSCKVIHGVDATKMATHPQLSSLKFDCIVYNFPHAGFSSLRRPRQEQISRHQALVRGFLANARKMIEGDGKIHITHKCVGFYHDWNIEMLGSSEGLQLVEEVPFNFKDYPGYCTKYGFGGDKNFNCNPSKLYKFQLALSKKKKTTRRKKKKA